MFSIELRSATMPDLGSYAWQTIYVDIYMMNHIVILKITQYV